jgi:serine/threonine-protein kinase
MIEPEELRSGKTLGQYELLLPLAKGATASVWAARPTSGLEKIVAVKAMLADLSDDIEAESMFLDEARLVSRIRHPNVASVLDLGEESEALYIVMEWVEGEPLQVLMRDAKAQGGIPLPLAVRIVKLAASGLHAAHELVDDDGHSIGLVHRDVSPQNILVGYDGSVKVIDFGVAKAASNMQKTSVGQIKGKIPFMSPEQAMGVPVDRRTDIFALGVVFYQLVTGQHPFRGDNEFATLARVRDDKPAASPSTIVPVPPAVEEVMLRMLAKNREQRPATMLELARQLDRALPPKPDEARVLGDLMRRVLWQRAARKNQAIREALASLGHKGRPVNLSIFPEDGPPPAPALPIAVPTIGAVPVAHAPAAPIAAPAPIAASEPVSEPARPRTLPKALVIVGAVLLGVAIGSAAWAVLGGAAPPPGPPTPAPHQGP